MPRKKRPSRSERHKRGGHGACSYCGRAHSKKVPSCGGHTVRKTEKTK